MLQIFLRALVSWLVCMCTIRGNIGGYYFCIATVDYESMSLLLIGKIDRNVKCLCNNSMYRKN